MNKKDFLESIDKVNTDDELHHFMLTVYYFLENRRVGAPKQLSRINQIALNSIFGNISASYLIALIEEYDKKYGRA